MATGGPPAFAGRPRTRAAGPPDRVRLTDQALVAVTLARRAGAEQGRPAHAADLLVGLAAEPAGAAGSLLRRHASSAARLLERAPVGSPGLPRLEEVVARAAAGERPRPAATDALLAALLEAGGTGIAELLGACGFDPSELYRATTRRPALAVETFGLGSDPDLSADAAVAVARVRAAGGGAVALVVAIAGTPAGDTVLALDDEQLAARLATLGAEEAAAGGEWDRGLDVVLDTARAWREPPLGIGDLLRAAGTVGGRGPRRLVEDAGRPAGGAGADRVTERDRQ